MVDLSKIYLYRMTHIQNVAHILKYGITHQGSLYRNPNYVSIGDSSIIGKRDTFEMPNGKMLGDYIPFYFGPRMPMLYVIQHGYNIVTSVAPRDIVYCVTSVATICHYVEEFCFTDGHAVNSFTTFYFSDRLKDIHKIIDMDAVKCKYWIDDNDLDLKRRKESEFLAGNDVPPPAILGFAVYNRQAKLMLADLPGISEKKIIVKPEYYF